MCLILFVIGIATLSAKAEEIVWQRDSLNIREDIIIDEEVGYNYQIQPTDKVIRVYNISISWAFTEEYDSIEAVLAGREVLGIYYIVKSQDGTWTKLVDLGDDNDLDIVEMEFVDYQALDACLSGEIVSRIAPDVQVYNTYYLSGETMYKGTAIYYVTDKGEYVHYFGGIGCIGEYLMPVEVFREVQKAIREVDQNPYVVRGSWDLSAYKIGSDTFNLNAEFPELKNDVLTLKIIKDYFWVGIPAGVCLLMVGIMFFVIHRRKKRDCID